MDAGGLERALARIPGVEAVRVVVSGGAPSEVHVLTRPGKPPKQVVRDIQSVASAGLRIQLDRRIVSVVQLDQDDVGCGGRPMFIDFTEEIDGSRCSVAVTVRWHDQQLVGRATGPASPATHMRLVAEATLAAVELGLRDDAAFAVSAVDVPRVGTHELAVVVLVTVVEGVELVLSGTATVGPDPAKSVAKAVLDALNRRLPRLQPV
jgi:hypothetical protein